MTHLPLPAKTPWVSPYIVVKDVDKALMFYQNAFKIAITNRVAGEDGTTWHAESYYKDQLIMFGKEGAYGSSVKSPITTGVASPMNLYLYCEDVDQFYKDAIAHGAKGTAAPEDTFWGDRMCRLEDLDNYVWCFATFLGERK